MYVTICMKYDRADDEGEDGGNNISKEEGKSVSKDRKNVRPNRDNRNNEGGKGYV